MSAAADATMTDAAALPTPAAAASPSPADDARSSPDAEAAAEAAAGDEAGMDADELAAEQAEAALDKRGGKGKKDAAPRVPLPQYHPLWSALDLPLLRRTLCDARSSSRRAARIIREGDSVIAYESRISMSPLVIKSGAVYGNRFGNFHHADMIGRELGSRIAARGKTRGWIVLLPLAPDLWTLSLTHRTQILYQADIAYIQFALDLKPGDVVFESGTGSGSLSTALAAAIQPHGHVHTFEFNADRVKKARVDFANNKLTDLITVRERDVCGNGFPLIEGGVNAVFLDLPSPWTVVPSAHAVLKHQGRVCSFSPCIEQVQRTCLKLDEFGFSDISTVEILLRSFELQTQTFPVAKPSPLVLTAAAAASAAPSSSAAADPEAKEAEQKKRALDSADAAESGDGGGKKQKLNDGTATAVDAPAAAPTASAPAAASAPKPAAAALPLSLVTTKPYQLMRGHTGYLTFATCNRF